MHSSLEHFQDSLERLEIQPEPNWVFPGRSLRREFFGCLRPFSVLKSVKIHPNLLFMNDYTFSRLVDVFPVSIQEINLTRRVEDAQVRQFFTGFLRRREEKVPNLRSVVNNNFYFEADFQAQQLLQIEGDYCFKYMDCYGFDKATMHVVDTTDLEAAHASGKWKYIRLPNHRWRGLEKKADDDEKEEERAKALFPDEES